MKEIQVWLIIFSALLNAILFLFVAYLNAKLNNIQVQITFLLKLIEKLENDIKRLENSIFFQHDKVKSTEQKS